jgi:sugar phosphate isomerase/epimerase
MQDNEMLRNNSQQPAMESKLVRRDFLARTMLAAGTLFVTDLLCAAELPQPSVHFPSDPLQRISVCSYPFREFIAGARHKDGNPTLELKDFAAHVVEKFNVKKIEPWSFHSPSTEPQYLLEFRGTVAQAGSGIANIAVDTHDSPYAAAREERDRAITHSMKWIDVAETLGSPSIRTNIGRAKDAQPDVHRVAESLRRVVDYASSKNIVVHLENDDEVSEDPLFLLRVVKKVNSAWLRLLPDFGNTLAAQNENYNYRALDAMFQYAYGICHVKNTIGNDRGEVKRVDLARTFGILHRHSFKGFCSIEYDSSGDPYEATAKLVKETIRYLS